MEGVYWQRDWDPLSSLDLVQVPSDTAHRTLEQMGHAQQHCLLKNACCNGRKGGVLLRCMEITPFILCSLFLPLTYLTFASAQETLTGFKWLGTVAADLMAKGYHFLFAFEEAIGFMVGDICLDKVTPHL